MHETMAQKRQQAPVPIFNKSKRPRLALVAHPTANTGPSQSQQKHWSQEKPSYSRQPWTNYPTRDSSTENTSFSHRPASTSQGPPNHTAHSHSANYPRGPGNYPRGPGNYQPRPSSSYNQLYQPPPSHHHQQQQQKHANYQTSFTPNQQNTTGYNRPPAATTTQAPTRTQGYRAKAVNKSFPVYPERSITSASTQFTRYQHTQPKQSENHPPLTTYGGQGMRATTGSVVGHTATGSVVGHTATGQAVGHTATGQAVEPAGKVHVAQTGRTVTKETKPRPSLRLLTATARGMKHWATYRTHTPLLFEIFGELTGRDVKCMSGGCKQFTLHTTDGPVDCQFWEIDRPLPTLAVGQTHRVVGQWDNKMSVIKCFSVRGVRVGEWGCVARCVEASDKTMRSFVGKIHEN